MNAKGDLDALDRNTLRLWRAMNLAGWGVWGAIAAYATAALAGFFVVRLATVALGAGTVAIVVGGIVVLGLASLVLGTIVGSHVYRWPGWVAFFAALALPLVYSVVAFPDGLWQAFAVAAGVGLVEGTLGSIVARWRWNLQPRALRAPADGTLA